MECPHCGSDFDSKPHTFQLGIDQDGTWQCANIRCPTCDRLIVSVRSDRGKNYPMLPPGSARAKLSEHVPAELAAEYWTASQVLPFSEEASAAMSRRLLQRVLSWKAGAGLRRDWPTRWSALSPPPACPTTSRKPSSRT